MVPITNAKAGASTFLELTDTPASYAAQKSRLAKVNIAETAMEFGEALPSGVYLPVLPGIQLYNAVKAVAWEDLNIAAVKPGLGRALCYIRVLCTNPARHAYFRTNGEATELSTSAQNCTLAYSAVSYVWVLTDENGIVEWRSDDAVPTYTLHLMAAIQNVSYANAQIFSGVLPAWGAGYNEYDLGIGRALVYLKVYLGGALVRDVWCRPDLSAGGIVAKGMDAIVMSAVDRVGYIFARTSTDGKIRLCQNAAGGTHTITLLAYIQNIEWFNSVVASGLISTTWRDITLPVGGGLAVIESTTPTGLNILRRHKGEAAIPGYTTTACVSVNPAEGGLNLLRTDDNGAFQECLDAGAPVERTETLMGYIGNVEGSLIPSKLRRAEGSLIAGVANAYCFNWQNPSANPIIVTKLVVNVTTPGGTAGSLLNAGSAAATATPSDNLIDGADLNATATYDNIEDRGVNGKTRQRLDANGGATDWVTGQITVANAAALAGKFYIEYFEVT